MTLSLLAVVDGDTMVLAGWQSEYMLIDPPFPRGAPQAVVDSFIRAQLIRVVESVEVSREHITKGTIEGAGGYCEEELPACLRTYWGLDSINGKDAVAELLAGPVPTVSFAYGYETTMTIAWVASLKRFLGVASCC